MNDSSRADTGADGAAGDGYPLDTLGMLLTGAPPAQPNGAAHDADAATSSTVVLPSGRADDLAILHAQVAIALGAADQPADVSDLVPVSAALDPDTLFRPELLEHLRRETRARVLLLHLPQDVPAGRLLRELAATVRSHAEIIGLPVPRILRYDPAPHPSVAPPRGAGLEALLADQRQALVIVPDASRRLLGDDIARLARLAAARECTVVAASAAPVEAWALGEHELDYIRELGRERFYSGRALADVLLAGLAAAREKLPAPLRSGLRLDTPIVGYETVAKVAEVLGSPQRVRALLRRVEREGGPDCDLSAMVGWAAREPLPALVRWWYAGLPRRDQLLALALALLADLPEAQLFPALEELVERAWGLRTIGQPMLDVYDLAPLRDMVRLDEHGPADARPDPELDSLRALLLPPALAMHRRHVQFAQLWLGRLAARSLDLPAEEQQPLFGPPRQRARLRAAAAAALADLALAAPALAQPGLLLLVADRRDDQHHALAQALARWSAAGQSARVLSLVDGWRGDDRSRRLVDALRGPADASAPAEESAEELHSAATLLVLGYAAVATPPSGPAANPAVAERLAAAARGAEGRRALRYLEREILPALLRHRLKQVGPLVRELAVRPALRSSLAESLAAAYAQGNSRAQVVVAMLKGWAADGFRAVAAGGRVPARSPSEDLLVTVAATVGALDYQSGGPMSLGEAWRHLRLILDRLDGRAARADVLAACMRLAAQDPGELRWALSAIRREEEGEVIASLTEICRQQRYDMALRGVTPGDGSTWTDGQPKTAIERALIPWLLDDPRGRDSGDYDDRRLRKLIMRTLVAFARALDFGDMAPGAPPPSQPGRRQPPADFYRSRIMPALIADKTDDAYEPAVYDLLPLALELARDEPHVLRFVLDRWAHDVDLSELGRGLILGTELEVAPYWGLQVVGAGSLARAVSTAIGQRR